MLSNSNGIKLATHFRRTTKKNSKHLEIEHTSKQLMSQTKSEIPKNCGKKIQGEINNNVTQMKTQHMKICRMQLSRA